MAISINVMNIPRVRAMLKAADVKVTMAVESAIKQSGFFIESEVVASVSGHRAEPESVDTGRFRSSVATTFPKKFEAKVESPLDYPKHLEYGTSRIQARSHFRNSADRNKSKVVNFIKDKVGGI